jgi:hypothetical protein
MLAIRKEAHAIEDAWMDRNNNPPRMHRITFIT